MNEKLNAIFDVEQVNIPMPTVSSRSNEVIVQDVPADKRLDSDFDSTRSNLYTLLHQGQEALEHALEVAKQSEHPRAFEVVGNLMKNLSDINHQLMDLHTKKQKLEAPHETTAQGNVTTNNAIFVGSTTDLAKALESIKKGS